MPNIKQVAWYQSEDRPNNSHSVYMYRNLSVQARNYFFCLNSFEETINYIVKGQGGKTRNLVMTLKALVGF